MADKLLWIYNDDTQNYPFWLKHLDTQSNEPANHVSIKVPKVVKPTNRETLFCTFGNVVPSLKELLDHLCFAFKRSMLYVIWLEAFLMYRWTLPPGKIKSPHLLFKKFKEDW